MTTSAAATIKRLREASDLTQPELARLLDPKLTPGSISQWESGRTSPSRERAIKLDRVLNANGEILAALGYVTVSAPADLGDMLTEILSEIRTHRRSDIAPTARLADMPTRSELRAEVEALRTELRADAAAAATARNKEIDGLTRAVAALDRKVEGLRSQSGAPAPRSAPSAAGRTSRSRNRTPRSGAAD